MGPLLLIDETRVSLMIARGTWDLRFRLLINEPPGSSIAPSRVVSSGLTSRDPPQRCIPQASPNLSTREGLARSNAFQLTCSLEEIYISFGLLGIVKD